MLLTVRSFKSLVAQPQKEWSNSYEVSTGEAAFTQILAQEIATGILAMEKPFHGTHVQFNRVVLSTWFPDSVPYNPNNLQTVPSVGLGIRPVTEQDQEALDTVLYIKKVSASGLNGRISYRGCLSDGDVISPQGRPRLTPGAQSALATLAVQAFQNYNNASPDVPLVMASVPLLQTIYNAAPQGVKQVVTKVYSNLVNTRGVVTFALGGVRRLDDDYN